MKAITLNSLTVTGKVAENNKICLDDGMCSNICSKTPLKSIDKSLSAYNKVYMAAYQNLQNRILYFNSYYSVEINV